MKLPKRIDGKFAIVIVVLVGLAGGSGGWWYQRSLQRRPLRLWGHEAGQLLLHAPHVDLLRLEPINRIASLPVDVLTKQGESFHAVKRVDVSHARGFLHLRLSLLTDHSFDWSGPNPSGAGQWRYALRFINGDHVATLLISGDFQSAMLAETGAQVSIGPIADGIETLFNEQMRDER
jgi:hypothetical protein